MAESEGRSSLREASLSALLLLPLLPPCPLPGPGGATAGPPRRPLRLRLRLLPLGLSACCRRDEAPASSADRRAPSTAWGEGSGCRGTMRPKRSRMPESCTSLRRTATATTVRGGMAPVGGADAREEEESRLLPASVSTLVSLTGAGFVAEEAGAPPPLEAAGVDFGSPCKLWLPGAGAAL